MKSSKPLLTGAAVVVAAALGLAGGSALSEEAVPEAASCEIPEITDSGACFAAGALRFVHFYNLQGASQFCKWRSANPGEWQRLKGYSASETPPTGIVTWFGSSIRNSLEAYFATGAPAFVILPNTAPNRCTGVLVKPPVVQGVTPGQTDATITVQEPTSTG